MELFDDPGYYVVVVALGDFAAVEGAGDQVFVGAEVVDENFAIDLWGVHLGAALPEETGFFAGAFDEDVHFLVEPHELTAGADGLLQLHEALAAGLDGAFGDFLVE